jgi:hypothetical protein
MTFKQIALLMLLISPAATWAQSNMAPPPGWFDGDTVAEASLAGIWWLKIPFTAAANDKGMNVRKQETNITSKYLKFGANGILFRSSLSNDEPPSAVGVWLLKDDKLFLTFSNVSLELECYMVRDDRILLAGTRLMGKDNAVVFGMLNRVREAHLQPLLEE